MFNLWYLVFLLGVQKLIVLCTKLKLLNKKKVENQKRFTWFSFFAQANLTVSSANPKYLVLITAGTATHYQAASASDRSLCSMEFICAAGGLPWFQV